VELDGKVQALRLHLARKRFGARCTLAIFLAKHRGRSDDDSVDRTGAAGKEVAVEASSEQRDLGTRIRRAERIERRQRHDEIAQRVGPEYGNLPDIIHAEMPDVAGLFRLGPVLHVVPSSRGAQSADRWTGAARRRLF
jgi:hypothetical protein